MPRGGKLTVFYTRAWLFAKRTFKRRFFDHVSTLMTRSVRNARDGHYQCPHEPSLWNDGERHQFLGRQWPEEFFDAMDCEWNWQQGVAYIKALCQDLNYTAKNTINVGTGSNGARRCSAWEYIALRFSFWMSRSGPPIEWKLPSQYVSTMCQLLIRSWETVSLRGLCREGTSLRVVNPIVDW